jgi:hypothetical protein
MSEQSQLLKKQKELLIIFLAPNQDNFPQTNFWCKPEIRLFCHSTDNYIKQPFLKEQFVVVKQLKLTQIKLINVVYHDV